MRSIVALLLIALSFLVFGFIALKWLPVIWRDGYREAYDQLIGSRLNLIAIASLITIGVLSFAAGVLAAPTRNHNR
jgi:Zn-dependent protease